jgi:hypothetical protein
MNAVLSALQELLRVALMAAIPVIIAGVEAGSVDYALVGSLVIVAVLKAVDKFVHANGLSSIFDMAFLDRFKS